MVISVNPQLMAQQAAAIRHSLHALEIEIAAGQIALDRGYQELEAQRQKAVQSGEAADAADVMEMRSSLANFRGKIADMRESLVGSATLIPIIGQNRKAAETRIMKISDGLLVVIPRLMAIASQAAVQVDIARAAKESEKLDDAARQITETKDIDLKLKMDRVPHRLPADVEYNLLRIAAAALSNAVKHSGAHTIEVAQKPAPARPTRLWPGRRPMRPKGRPMGSLQNRTSQ